MFEGEVTGKNIPSQREKSAVDFRRKLKTMKEKVTSFLSAGNSEETSSQLDLQGLDRVNLIPPEDDKDNLRTRENKTRAEIWLEKELKMAEEEVKLTNVFTKIDILDDRKWVVETKDGDKLQTDPYSFFEKYFPNILPMRRFVIIDGINYAKHKTENDNLDNLRDFFQDRTNSELQGKVEIVKLPLVTIYMLNDEESDLLFRSSAAGAMMVKERRFMVIRKSYAEQYEQYENTVIHEYQHFMYYLLKDYRTEIKSTFLAKANLDPFKQETTRSKDIRDIFQFKDEIISYLVDGSNAEKIKEDARWDLYNYRKIEYERNLIDLDNKVELDPESLQEALEHNNKLAEEYNKISDRTNYLIEIDKLIDIAFEIRDLIKERYSNENNQSQFGIPDMNLIFPETNNFDDYEISLITASLLRDTSTENWFKLVDLLKSVAEKEDLGK
jgi:hypothetical protein